MWDIGPGGLQRGRAERFVASRPDPIGSKRLGPHWLSRQPGRFATSTGPPAPSRRRFRFHVKHLTRPSASARPILIAKGAGRCAIKRVRAICQPEQPGGLRSRWPGRFAANGQPRSEEFFSQRFAAARQRFPTIALEPSTMAQRSGALRQRFRGSVNDCSTIRQMRQRFRGRSQRQTTIRGERQRSTVPNQRKINGFQRRKGLPSS